jgi:HAD superfamily hydrolase (TIGR01459 family)
MTQAIQSLIDMAEQFDAIVLDQWGVLHDGSTPYTSAIATLEALRTAGTRLAVLSNSGKRSAPNAARIAAMGFDPELFEIVMTSGEALWQDIAKGRLAYKTLCPITRDADDAEDWADGLDISLTRNLTAADAILLMGLPDSVALDHYTKMLADARANGIPVLCTNPDRASPRAGGAVVTSPGALAHDHIDVGGDVRFYGKPHAPVFRAVEVALNLPAAKLLMVGDSLEHDIAGGHGAGWSTAFIRGGLHAAAFTGGVDVTDTIARLAAEDTAPMPTFTLAQLE